MHPRDIVLSSATLLGLVITAFGAMVALSQGRTVDVLRNFAFVFVGVVILFTLSVLMACMLSIMGRLLIWRLTILTYSLAWVFLGAVVVFILLGYVYGIQFLQPQLPQFDPLLVSSIAGLLSTVIASVVSSYAVYMRRRSKKLAEQIQRTMSPSERKDANKIELKLLSGVTDPVAVLVKLRMEIEREIRRICAGLGFDDRSPLRSLHYLIERGVIDVDLGNSTRYVYEQCSRAIHGMPMDVGDAERIVDLGTSVLVAMKRITPKR